MTIVPRGTGYQTSFNIQGLRYRAQFDTVLQAQTWELEVRLAVKKGEPPLAPNTTRAVTKASPTHNPLETLGGLFDYVKEHRWAGKKSALDLIRNGRYAVEFFGRDRLVRTFGVKDVDQYVRHLRSTRNSNGTINRKLAAVSKLITEAVKHGVLKQRLMIERTKEPEGRLRYLEADEEQAIAGTLRLWAYDHLADLTEFLVDTGLRVSEALGLTWADCKAGSLQVVGKASEGEAGSKSGRTRHVPQTERVTTILSRRRMLSPRGPFEGISYESYRHRMERAAAHLGLAGVSIHTLRHTFASRLVMAGVPLFTVSTLLGHADMKTTQRYAHLSAKSLDGIVDALAQFAKPRLRVVA